MNLRYVWSQEMSVGVQELDEQHQHLFQLINDLLVLVTSHPNAELQRKHELLDGIMNYNLYHLRFEEERMQEFDCVDGAHFKNHQWYREGVGKMFDETSPALRNGSSNADELCHAVACFAGDWHVGHVLHFDRGYTSCFNEHGLH